MAETPKRNKVDYTKIPKSVTPQIIALEDLFKAAEEFVLVHYETQGTKDRNIKVLATVNQLIELKKFSLPMPNPTPTKETNGDRKG